MKILSSIVRIIFCVLFGFGCSDLGFVAIKYNPFRVDLLSLIIIIVGCAIINTIISVIEADENDSTN